MIAVISTKENKKTNINLTKYLEGHGFETWNFWKDTSGLSPKEAFNEQLNKFSVIVFMLNKESITDSFLLSLYRRAFEKNKEIVLYMQTKLGTSLPNWFFLENHDWINAYEVSFDTSVKALAELLEEYQNEYRQVSISAEDKRTLGVNNSEKKSKKHSAYVIIGVLLLFGVIYLIIHSSSSKTSPVPENTEKNKSYEELIIGTWGMKDYYDDIQRSVQELIYFQKTIVNLKKNFRMIFYPNHMFVRIGFTPKVERGYWRVDQQNKYLYITDLQKTGEDRLKILTLNENELIFEISVYSSSHQVNVTRITLYKISQNPQKSN